MNLKDLQEQWNDFGKIDPLWAILTWPEKKNRGWNAAEFFETGRREISALLSYLYRKKLRIAHGRALDFGCGVGRLTRALAEYFHEAHGVDIAPSMIHLARGYKNSSSCFYHLYQNNDLGLFEDNYFDFIYSRLVLQHMEPEYAKNYIKEFLRILKPGGILVFHEPDRLTDVWAQKYAKQRMNVNGRIKALIPDRVLGAYYKVWAKLTRSPIMEVYGIARAEMEQFLLSQGASIIEITEFNDAAPEWISSRYILSK